jgi:Phosphoribosylcarboxyaminoimidazole (NCAIR) mutase
MLCRCLKVIPVGTFAIGTSGCTNAALLAISILSINDEKLSLMLKSYRNKQTDSIDKIPK